MAIRSVRRAAGAATRRPLKILDGTTRTTPAALKLPAWLACLAPLCATVARTLHSVLAHVAIWL
eukprot:1038075-Pleurochrysis_carterae.AAC.1